MMTSGKRRYQRVRKEREEDGRPVDEPAPDTSPDPIDELVHAAINSQRRLESQRARLPKRGHKRMVQIRQIANGFLVTVADELENAVGFTGLRSIELSISSTEELADLIQAAYS